MDFMSKIAIFMLMLESTCSIDIVDDYKLNLTSSGPAVRGSFIDFQAQLYLGASKTPTKDEELFRYDWRDSVYLLTESQHANFNTSYKPCFDSLVEPRTYSMRVSVYDAKKKSIFVPVTRKDIDFTITSTLNGNLKHNQTVHRGLRASNNTFSTGKPVHFTANLTDIFILPPTFTYKWLKDGEEYAASNVNNISLTFEKTGKHVVRLDVVSTGIPVDCRGDEYLDSLKGSFKTEIILKGIFIH
ncbi:uncharacterized protein LOC132720468 [Ruditapes philippinarum]|uniref:uncharacterized protein LOC132720468 n=1 Tax=Ruditapes philippinarum TaxID=129788 RepID=UPI00295ABBFE|nr:uncharacterized protein LOC132720468 [Ruditapes philippinarum]XP_060560598.1 uncharacterized protein LOC132720468 [Ruditapes philippinarum]